MTITNILYLVLAIVYFVLAIAYFKVLYKQDNKSKNIIAICSICLGVCGVIYLLQGLSITIG